MAWIESNQELADHPKTRKLARLLDASIPTVVGHLHCLWWWALDYADDGDLSRFDDLDLALGARWDGDEGEFVSSLIASGFVDPDRRIHDWEDYTGKLVNRRRANAARMREARAHEHEPRAPLKEERASHVQRTQRARVEPQDKTRQDKTRQDRTETETEPREARPSPETPPPKPAEGPAPFALLEALCEEQGQDTSVLSKSERGKQLAVAKRLAESGMDEADVRRCTRWLLSQSWVTGGVDFFLVEKQRAKWQLSGRPETATVNGRASPGATTHMDRVRASHERLRRKAAGEHVT